MEGNGDPPAYADALRGASADKIAVIVLSTIVKLASPYIKREITDEYVDIKMSQITQQIGQAI